MRFSRAKRAGAVLATAGALAAGIGAPAASAQQSGLVNVEITNLLNHNAIQVTVPINAAANVCGVSVNALSALIATAPVNCTAGANQQFRVLGFAA